MNAAKLRKLSLAMQGATEVIQWGDNRVFKVAGKMFAVSGFEPDSLYSIKVDPERFLELTDRPGIRPAPYLARAKWVQIDAKACDLPEKDLHALLRRSYDLVFAKLTKKAQQAVLDG